MKKRKGLKVYADISSNTDILLYKLYDTVILSISNKYFKLNTGGFKTNHTKNCMNDNLPDGYTVYQKDFEWYLSTPKGDLEFLDEMVITL